MCIYSYVWTVESKSVHFPYRQLATSLFAAVSNCLKWRKIPRICSRTILSASLLAFWSPTHWTCSVTTPLPCSWLLCCEVVILSQSERRLAKSQRVNTYIEEAWPRPSKAVKSWNFFFVRSRLWRRLLVWSSGDQGPVFQDLGFKSQMLLRLHFGSGSLICRLFHQSHFISILVAFPSISTPRRDWWTGKVPWSREIRKQAVPCERSHV